MAPFIVNHPTLLNNWIVAKEIALKTIREIKDVKTEDSDLFKIYLKKSMFFTNQKRNWTIFVEEMKPLIKD